MTAPSGPPRGPLGQRIVLDGSLLRATEQNRAFDRAVRQALRRFILGDWGIVSRATRAENAAALRSSAGRIIGRYPTPEALGNGPPDHEVVILTDERREATLVIFSGDY